MTEKTKAASVLEDRIQGIEQALYFQAESHADTVECVRKLTATIQQMTATVNSLHSSLAMVISSVQDLRRRL